MAQYKTQNSKKYIMTGEEVERMHLRVSHNDVLKKVQEAKRHFGDKSKKLTHTMYVHSIGKIPHFERLPNSVKFDSEMIENYLETAILYEKAEELVAKRDDFAVIEDDFGPTLEQIMQNGKKPSYINLVAACRAHGKDENEVDIHCGKCEITFRYFTKRGIQPDDARAYALAIAFYTGAYSAKLSMEADIICRRLVTANTFYSDDGTVDSDAAMIMYYLIKGLSHIDFYWGTVVRYVKLDDKDLQDYKPGEIITWLQFSSADKGGKDMSHFTDRNTIFIISSLTGRSIQYFSNCADEEDEVLFLPHSSFIVCDVKYDETLRKNNIYLRQVELGLCKNVVLWVDDNIFDATWENKRHMEKASTLGTCINVHFVPKSNTDSALTFLRSEFGQRIKESHTFRIVTDMKRTNEDLSSSAGARFLCKVRNLGFQQSCLIFTGHDKKAAENLKSVFGSKDTDRIKITANPEMLEKFVTFEPC